MSTTTRNEPEIEAGRLPTILARILAEGYGPGAWHGPDLGGAVSDVTSETAFQRPMTGRHNIAEIALHHAWYVQVVTGRLTGKPTEPFSIEGEDWFELYADGPLSWTEVRSELAARQAALTSAVAELGRGGTRSPLSPAKQLDEVLGITCHAVYHAGQIQFIKRLLAG